MTASELKITLITLIILMNLMTSPIPLLLTISKIINSIKIIRMGLISLSPLDTNLNLKKAKKNLKDLVVTEDLITALIMVLMVMDVDTADLKENPKNLMKDLTSDLISEEIMKRNNKKETLLNQDLVVIEDLTMALIMVAEDTDKKIEKSLVSLKVLSKRVKETTMVPEEEDLILTEEKDLDLMKRPMIVNLSKVKRMKEVLKEKVKMMSEVSPLLKESRLSSLFSLFKDI